MKTYWIVVWALFAFSTAGLSQPPAATPAGDLSKAICTATASCELGGVVQCSGRRSSTSCVAVDYDCSTGETGYVICDGVKTPCGVPGEVCHLEQRPAATLLLPYFEVDTIQGGPDTLVAIANAFANPVLVNAVVWSDLGVPVFGFNLYLGGYDVQTFSLYTLLVSDDPHPIPPTEPPAGEFPSCQGILPPAPISSDFRQSVRNALLGLGATQFNGRCVGAHQPAGNTVLRGYMTFDAIAGCTFLFPGDFGYFSPPGIRVATNQNALSGDYIYLGLPIEVGSPPTAIPVTAGLPLVHIRASCSDPATTSPGRYTFYGRLVDWNAADNRQPLATNFGVRLMNQFPLGSDVVVWRDPKTRPSPFDCGLAPAWYPLEQERLLGFDEAGQQWLAVPGGISFPAVAQRVHAGTDLPVPFSFGWLYLDLNGTVAAAGNNPPVDPAAEQAWVSVLLAGRMSPSAGIASAFDAFKYDTACAARHYTP